MSREFTEVPLIREVYLRIEENTNKPSYSLRPFIGITPFPISGGTYFGNELEHPKDDLLEILKLGSMPYQAFQESVDSFGQTFVEDHESREFLNKLVREAQELFFEKQSERLFLVGRELRRTIVDTQTSSHGNFPNHYTAADFSSVYDAVTGLHRAVQGAESSFDRLVIGSSVNSKDKYGKELYVESPLELAEKTLAYLKSNDRAQKRFEVLGENRLEEVKTNITNSIKRLQKRLN